MSLKLENSIKLNKEEGDKFAYFIKTQRKKLISSPIQTTKNAAFSKKDTIDNLLKHNNISELIINLRQLSYDQFLIEESKFNGIILSKIAEEFDGPKKMLYNVSNQLYGLENLSLEEFHKKVITHFGDFAGSISPYIYQLCLSNTQSRRSRAGKVFETIIYFLYECYGYKYESQATIGKKTFSKLGLGKVVDSVLPSTKAFLNFRNKTIVGSMKTTLRERWQEVVEEISRSNLPNIHLLTVDENISVSKAKQMAEHNIILVVTKSTKANHILNTMHNVIDFETYFLKEIPLLMDYWRQHNG